MRTRLSYARPGRRRAPAARFPVMRRAVSRETVEGLPPELHETLDQPGRPLDPATRSVMESRFDRDFSAVRVHTDDAAARSASAIDARAFTTGNDIAFASAAYAPQTRNGQYLLAHE